MLQRFLCVCALIVIAVPAARAQEKGQIGMTMGYPSSVGMIVHLTDRIAVRPDFRFITTSQDDNLIDDSSHTLGFGISGLIYLTKDDALRTYVTPRFLYNRTTSESSLAYSTSIDLIGSIGSTIGLPGTSIIPAPTTYSTTSTNKAFSGSFGAQYSLHKRFSVFGEVGVAYNWSSLDFDFGDFGRIGIPESLTDGPHTWASQSAVGVILYFKD